MLKKLAAMSEKGEYYYKLGAMYGDDERWKESKDMLEKAMQKGGLKRSGEAWMRLAVAEHGMKNTPAAVAALQKAVGFDETRKQARRMVASPDGTGGCGALAIRRLHPSASGDPDCLGSSTTCGLNRILPVVHIDSRG